jgi:hypothetical protein
MYTAFLQTKSIIIKANNLKVRYLFSLKKLEHGKKMIS